MKILFISKESNGGDMSLRLALEGNQVKFHISEPDLHNLDGLIEKEKNWRAGVNWADLIVFDDTGMDQYTSYVLKSGKPAFGMGHSKEKFKVHGASFEGHAFAGELEKNRNMSQEVMSELGIGEEIESLSFTDTKEAIEHLKKCKKPHAIKPETHGSGSEKTFIGEMDDNSDAIDHLEQLHTRPGGAKIKKIEVEEVIRGVEVACSSWFNGKDWIGPVNINLEHKKLYSGNNGDGIGQNTGEQGTLMFYDERPAAENKFFQETLAKMGKWLSQFDYRGQMDINTMVNEEGIWPLEFTPRLGYPSSYIEDELQITPWGELFDAIAKGKNIENKVSYDWGMGVVLSGEGYPYWDEGHKRMDRTLIQGITLDNIADIHPYDLMFDGKKIRATGCYPVTACTKGKTIKQCQDYLYNTLIPSIKFPTKGYRDDIGDRVPRDMKRLKEFGYDFGRYE